MNNEQHKLIPLDPSEEDLLGAESRAKNLFQEKIEKSNKEQAKFTSDKKTGSLLTKVLTGQKDEISLKSPKTKSPRLTPRGSVDKKEEAVVNIKLDIANAKVEDEDDVVINKIVTEIERAKESDELELKEKEKREAQEEESKSRFYRLCVAACCYRVPLVSFPIGPVILIFIVFTTLGTLFAVSMPDKEISGVKLYLWMFWPDFLLLTHIVVHLFIKVILILVKGLFFFSRFNYYVNTLAGSATLFVWVIIQFGSFQALLRLDDPYVTSMILNTLQCLLYISIFRGIKLVFVKFIIAYSQRNIFWRTLSDLLFKEKVLSTLLKAPKKKPLPRKIDDTTRKFSPEDRPTPVEFRKAWKRIFSFESVAVDRAKQHSGTLPEAIQTANKMFVNVDVNHKGHLELSDFIPFFKSKTAASEAFLIFDKDKDNKVLLEEAIIIIREIYRDRKALYNTLHDREDIAAILNNSLGVLFWFFMFLLCLSVFGISIQAFWVPLSTSILGLAFIFGNSLKDVWENFIFVFFIRPFDIGDKITIEGYPTLVVSRINLLLTETFATDGRQFLVPNSILRSKVITQYKRSKNYCVYLQFHLGLETKKETIEKLQKRIRKWLKNDTAPWNYQDSMMWISEVSLTTNRLVFEIWAELKGVTYQVSSLYLLPKSRLLLYLQSQCQELGINYSLPVQVVNLKKTE